jgi:hypothetical protein
MRRLTFVMSLGIPIGPNGTGSLCPKADQWHVQEAATAKRAHADRAGNHNGICES